VLQSIIAINVFLALRAFTRIVVVINLAGFPFAKQITFNDRDRRKPKAIPFPTSEPKLGANKRNKRAELGVPRDYPCFARCNRASSFGYLSKLNEGVARRGTRWEYETRYKSPGIRTRWSLTVEPLVSCSPFPDTARRQPRQKIVRHYDGLPCIPSATVEC